MTNILLKGFNKTNRDIGLHLITVYEKQFHTPERLGLHKGCIYVRNNCSVYIYHTKTQIVAVLDTSKESNADAH